MERNKDRDDHLRRPMGTDGKVSAPAHDKFFIMAQIRGWVNRLENEALEAFATNDPTVASQGIGRIMKVASNELRDLTHKMKGDRYCQICPPGYKKCYRGSFCYCCVDDGMSPDDLAIDPLGEGWPGGDIPGDPKPGN